MDVAGMTEWKWVRIPAPVHTRLEAVKERMQADRARVSRAQHAVNYGEVIENLLNAWGEETDRGVDLDHGRSSGLPGDAGSGNVDRVGDTGGT